jgi:PleD family two-component response regulator
VSVSIGIYVGVPAPGVRGDQLLAKADEALYNAKDSGRNCVRLYDAENGLVKP